MRFQVSDVDGVFEREIDAFDEEAAAEEWAKITHADREWDMHDVVALVRDPAGDVTAWKVTVESVPRFSAWDDDLPDTLPENMRPATPAEGGEE